MFRLFVFSFALPLVTTPVQVDSVSALQARIDAAKPGEVITVKDGTYTTTAPIRVSVRGAAGRPTRIVGANSRRRYDRGHRRSRRRRGSGVRRDRRLRLQARVG